MGDNDDGLEDMAGDEVSHTMSYKFFLPVPFKVNLLVSVLIVSPVPGG